MLMGNSESPWHGSGNTRCGVAACAAASSHSSGCMPCMQTMTGVQSYAAEAASHTSRHDAEGRQERRRPLQHRVVAGASQGASPSSLGCTPRTDLHSPKWSRGNTPFSGGRGWKPRAPPKEPPADMPLAPPPAAAEGLPPGGSGRRFAPSLEASEFQKEALGRAWRPPAAGFAFCPAAGLAYAPEGCPDCKFRALQGKCKLPSFALGS